MTNHGLIDANLAAVTMTVDPSASGVTNVGIMQASEGGILRLQNGTFTNTGALIQAMDDGSQVQLAGATIIGGALSSSGSGKIVVPDSTFGGLSGTVTNNALVSLLSSSSTGADLKIADGATLDGNGRMALGAHVNNRISGVIGNEELVNTATHTISGGGQLGVNALQLTNQGLIDANLPGITLYINPNALGLTNTGVIQASEGGIVRLQDGTFTNSGALIQALDGSQAQLGVGSTVIGGTLSSIGSGKIVVTDNTFSGTTFSTLSGMITNNGLVTLESSGNLTDLRITDGTTINGSGRVVLGGHANNRIYGDVTGSEELINSATHTIAGGGQLGANLLKLTNQGIIDANLAAGSLYINPSDSGVTNTGTIQASASGIVRLQDGTFTNTGGLLQALDDSQVQLGEGSTVIGGTLSSSGSGKIVVTDNTFSGATFSILSGTITNNGLVSLESSGNLTDLKITDGTMFTGSGRVVLGGLVSNRIYGEATGSEELINSATHTISGGGQLGANLLTLTNQGLIDANLGSALIVNPSAAGVVNQATGILRGSGSAGLQLTDGTFDNQGTVEALNGSNVTYSTSAVTANNVAGVLTGGTWRAVATDGGATITLQGANNITQIASGAEVVLSGVGSVLRRATTPIEATLTVNDGTLRILDGRAFTMTNPLSNTGIIELAGAGLADAALTTSTLTNSGTLVGHGMVVGNILNLSGTVSPGSSPGTLHVSGDYSQSAAATLQIELASPSSFDKLDVTGHLALGGTLRVELIDFLPGLGNSFDILDWGTVGGTFAVPLQLPPLPGGLNWSTTQLYTTGELAVGGVPGDYNLDGFVDAADYTVWRDQLGAVGWALAADGDADGEVTHADYDVWKSHFGEAAAASPQIDTTVPEPGAMLLVLALLATSVMVKGPGARIRACRDNG